MTDPVPIAREVPLEALEVLVADCQATGASPSHGSLLELGWLRTRAEEDEGLGVPTSVLVQLPEGARLPRPVSRITGIRREDLAGATSEPVAWASLLAEAAQMPDPVPTVIHYARFEQSFFAHLQQRYAPEVSLPFDVVCTHAIARRLLPELPRRGLRALAGYYGFDVALLRRSAGHVAATAHVWRHVVPVLAERGIPTWSALREWLDNTRAPTSKRRYPMERKKRLGLPDKPGVYKMLRTSGDVLYVGKATSLKKRVNSYFTKHKGVNERALEMLSQARDLEVEPTETALEAALLEADAIKVHRPPYNVHLLEEQRDVWFASRDLRDVAMAPDDHHAVGPLPSRRSMSGLRAIVDELMEIQEGRDWRPARALGAAPSFAPERAVFAAGFAQYRRQWLGREGMADPLQSVMALGKRLWSLHLAGELELDGDPDEEDKSWDPDRVARHLLRVTLYGGQLLRRSRWLVLLHDASVAWREDTSSDERRRLLIVADGEVVERGHLGPGAALPKPASRERSQILQSFDIARYDRLRVLSTELKRVMHQSGAAAVRLPRGTLFGPALAGVLEVV